MLGLNPSNTMDAAEPKRESSTVSTVSVVPPLANLATMKGSCGHESVGRLSSARSASSSRTANAIKGAREKFARANRLPPVSKSVLCPLSQDLMKDPVRICNGRVFERAQIQEWFARGNVVCPVTQERLESKELTPDFVLREMIQDYVNLREHSQGQQASFTEYLAFVEGKLVKKLMASRQQVEALRAALSNANRSGSPLTSGYSSATSSRSPPKVSKEGSGSVQPMQSMTLSGSSSHASVCSLAGSGLGSGATTDAGESITSSDEECSTNPTVSFGPGQAPRNPRTNRSPSRARAQSSFSKRQWFMQLINM